MSEKHLFGHDTCTLDEGTANFQWPSELSHSSRQELCYWLELVLRKIQRPLLHKDQVSDTLCIVCNRVVGNCECGSHFSETEQYDD